MKTITLSFRDALHLSNRRGDYGRSEGMIHSDTLHAAILDMWRWMGHIEWIDAHKDQFVCSSLFPVAGISENEPVYFFPKPYFLAPGMQKSDDLEVKKLKKLQWLDWNIFRRWTQGATFDFFPAYLRSEFAAEKWPATLEKKLPLERDVVPRAQVSRSEDDTTIYYVERLYFGPDCGLFGLIHADTNEIEAKCLAALRLLGDQGIGTDRNIGMGQFSLGERKDGFSNSNPNQGNFLLSLGLFCPEERAAFLEMIEGETPRYELIQRGGWLGEPYNTYRKRSVQMLKEGSLLAHLPDKTKQIAPGWYVMGKLWDLAPQQQYLPLDHPVTHPVYRSGKTLFYSVNL